MKKKTKQIDFWTMPNVLDDPGKIIIMAGDSPQQSNQFPQSHAKSSRIKLHRH